MEIVEMNMEQIEARMAEIGTEADAEGADIKALNEEMDALVERKAAIEQAAAEKRSLLEKVAQNRTLQPIDVVEERKPVDMTEVRNSPAYIEAYSEYIKTGDDTECRTLLTTENDTTPNGSATVAVPDFVYDIVKTAWEKDGIMSLVRKAYLKGNLKVNFEISGDDAVVHAEGAAAINPENLVLGMVEMKPESIKKVLPITDEIADLRGEAFLRYVYDEITYRIAKKAADTLIAKIVAAGTQSTTTAVGVPVHTSTQVTLSLVAEAMSKLSAEAENPVIIMNRQTWGAFKAAQAAGNYMYDPFEGLQVLYNNSLTAFSAATTGVTYAIVGDLGQGALANFPNGDGIDFKFDDMTRKKEDIIEIMGRQYVALGLVGPNCFVKINH